MPFEFFFYFICGFSFNFSVVVLQFFRVLSFIFFGGISIFFHVSRFLFLVLVVCFRQCFVFVYFVGRLVDRSVRPILFDDAAAAVAPHRFAPHSTWSLTVVLSP